MPSNSPVLIVDLAKYYGGADVRVLQLARLLHGKYPYCVATLKDSPIQKRLEDENLNVLPVPYGRGDPRVALFLAKHLRSDGYTVIDAHNPQAQMWSYLASLLSRKTRSVTTVHSSYGLEHQGNRKGRFYEGVLWLNRRRGSRFIAVSEAVENYLHQIGVPSPQIHLIHNSIEPVEVSETKSTHSLQESLGWNKDNYIVIVVARLEPIKGHQYLIQALAAVAPNYPNIRCLVVGDGRLKDTLATQIESLNLTNVVHLAGFRNDIADLLEASDAFCLPSLSEGLPFALLEAAIHHRPLLVSRVGGMAELLSHKETGYLVSSESPAELQAGLEWFLTHPEDTNRMAQTAYELVYERFNPDTMIEKTIQVYNEV